MYKRIYTYEDLEKFATRLARAFKYRNNKPIPFNELLNANFMKNFTRYTSIDEFFEDTGYKIETLDDINSIPDDVLDLHVASTTKFRSWHDMKKAARNEFIKGPHEI